MAEEKDNQEKAEKPPKKKLTAMVGVLVGAALGGAGVVVLNPTHAPEPVPVKPVVQVATEWLPTDLEFEFTFNPQAERGKAFAHINFKIAVLVQPGKFEQAKAMVAQRKTWAYSGCLEIMSAQTALELKSPDGKRHLKRLLMDELTHKLFPGSADERIAAVEDILWTKFVIQ